MGIEWSGRRGVRWAMSSGRSRKYSLGFGMERNLDLHQRYLPKADTFLSAAQPGNLASIVKGKLIVTPPHGNTSSRKCCTSFVNSGDPSAAAEIDLRDAGRLSLNNDDLWLWIPACRLR